jgi:LysR family transcriptional regulator, glycine cleavage system transcriptional activator
VLSDAGLMICGLALLADRLDDGDITLPFPVATGAWTEHVFQAHFRKDALARSQVSRFRAWLEDEALATTRVLERRAGSPG